MPRVTQQLRHVVEEYKAGLALVAAILALGWLMGPQPDPGGALNRVYNVDAQPVVCQIATKPPTR